MNKARLFYILVLFGVCAPVHAQTAQQYAELGTCHLENGAVISGCRLGFRTAGQLNEDRSNVVLFPSWYGGDSAAIMRFVAPDGLVDSGEWFVIAVDAFGNGLSSSPSNSATQDGDEFPEFSVRDMVDAQKRLLEEEFEIDGIHAVVGISMGGMQAFEWLVAYPAFMNKVVSIVGSPQLTSYDLFFWQAQVRALEQCLEAGCANPGALSVMALNLASLTPEEHVARTSREQIASALKRLEEQGYAFPVDDRLSQMKAMIGHDIARDHGGSLAAASEVARASVLLIVASQDSVVRPETSVSFGRHVSAEVILHDSPCGHQVVQCEGTELGLIINRFLAARSEHE